MLRGRVGMLLGINVAAAVIVPLIGLSSTPPPSVKDLLHGWGAALVYTNVTDIPALLAGPRIAEGLAGRNWPLSAAVVVTSSWREPSTGSSGSGAVRLSQPELQTLFGRLADSLRKPPPEYPDRIASRLATGCGSSISCP